MTIIQRIGAQRADAEVSGKSIAAPIPMFTMPRPNLYESSDGFSVEVLGQTGLTYREGAREMFVDSEVLIGPAGMVVYRDTIRQWKAPRDGEVITGAERGRILQNIREAFQFQGFEIEVI